jgi:hypothetical protein
MTPKSQQQKQRKTQHGSDRDETFLPSTFTRMPQPISRSESLFDRSAARGCLYASPSCFLFFFRRSPLTHRGFFTKSKAGKTNQEKTQKSRDFFFCFHKNANPPTFFQLRRPIPFSGRYHPRCRSLISVACPPFLSLGRSDSLRATLQEKRNDENVLPFRLQSPTLAPPKSHEKIEEKRNKNGEWSLSVSPWFRL